MPTTPPIRRAELTTPPEVVYGIYAACVLYTVATHWLARRSSAIRLTAMASTAGDALIVGAICSVTGGLASDFYPYFYLTIPATSMRFGTRETFLAFALHAVLTAALYLWAAGPPAVPSELALRIFYLLFSALIGSLLSRAARENAHRARAERDKARHLLWRLIHAEEEERKRVAGEIHDRMGRQLFELYYGIDRCRETVGDADPQAAAMLARLGADARAC